MLADLLVIAYLSIQSWMERGEISSSADAIVYNRLTFITKHVFSELSTACSRYGT